jgi:hypothetical protein
MKHVIKRHATDLQVFRALAVAQAAAAAAPGAEIFVECFDAYKNLVALAPAIKWKNPHHPYAVTERAKTIGPDGKEIAGRPGGKLYDEVIDLDPDTPLETEFFKSGLPWWRFITAKVNSQSDFGAKLKLRAFPEILDPPCPFSEPPPGFILLAPLSQFLNPRALNVNDLEAYAKKLFPGYAVFYAVPGNAFLGEGRNLLRYDSPSALAWILKAATAVFAVNGIVSALAQSTVNGKRLVRRYCHIRALAGAGAARDNFLKFCSMMETELDRGQDEPACSIATITAKGLIETEKPFPAD